MITATLTNKRHIAAATKAYEATIPVQPEDPEAEPIPAPYADVDAYVQAALERVADSWADSTGVDKITVSDFVFRFTAAEYGAITASQDATVMGIIAKLKARGDIRLGSVEAIQGAAYLVSIGLLTQERADEVLDY